MYIREWRGRAKQTEAAKYSQYFRAEVVRQLRRAAGFQGAGTVSVNDSARPVLRPATIARRREQCCQGHLSSSFCEIRVR